MATKRQLQLDPTKRIPLLKAHTSVDAPPKSLPVGKQHSHPAGSTGDEDASIFFIGTATTIIEWQGIRILTDPNFLHAGDHVHLGPGVTAERKTNPALDIDELPPLDCILLSHYHADHFDQLVEESLNRDFPIISTPHAKDNLTSANAKKEPFRSLYDLDHFESMTLPIKNTRSHGTTTAVIKVTGMPGKHVPPGPLSVANDLLQAVPPTNGWLLEMGYTSEAAGDNNGALQIGYRIYISGDTLFVDDLKEIPKRLKDEKIDLMLVHLGGTTIPGPSMPLLMVTMDAKQGLQLLQLVDPDVTIPIHYDDYTVFLSPLSDFKSEVDQVGLQKRVVYLDRGEQYRFKVKRIVSGSGIGSARPNDLN